jgi:hypothetical protein
MLAGFRAQLLELINIERGLAGVPTLALDEFTCRVENVHALDMATGRFLSHWGSDGRKPYHRYSFGGGTDFTQENVSGTDLFLSSKPAKVAAELISMNLRMHAERPPHDGHRRAILAPQHTHVGFGIALYSDSLRLAEMFSDRYVEIDLVPREAKRNATVLITERLLNRQHILQQAEVFYEPLPLPDPERRTAGRRYGLPDEFVTLRPTLAQNMYYADGLKGTIEIRNHGQFRIPVRLFKEQTGIYTIVLWLKKTRQEKGFTASEICIKAE